jgi:hypothetical protein
MLEKPTRMYATKPNPNANDFNAEPWEIEVPYDVWECKDGKCLVNRAGWDGKKHRHYIKESDLHFKK